MKIETVITIETDFFNERSVGAHPNLAWCEQHASWQSELTQGYMFCVADYYRGLSPWYDKRAMLEAACSEAFVNAFHKAIALGPTYVMIEAVD